MRFCQRTKPSNALPSESPRVHIHPPGVNERARLSIAAARVVLVKQATFFIHKRDQVTTCALQAFTKGCWCYTDQFARDMTGRFEDLGEHVDDALFARETQQHAEHATHAGIFDDGVAFG